MEGAAMMPDARPDMQPGQGYSAGLEELTVARTISIPATVCGARSAQTFARHPRAGRRRFSTDEDRVIQ